MSEEFSDRVRDETTHEGSDASSLLVLALMAAVGATLVVSVIILSLVYHGELNPPSNAPNLMVPQPRLQVDEQGDLQHFRAEVEKRLNSYGWIDRPGGIVRIPIKQAIERAAANGYPDWPGKQR